jgi:hypothetical protein
MNRKAAKGAKEVHFLFVAETATNKKHQASGGRI